MLISLERLGDCPLHISRLANLMFLLSSPSKLNSAPSRRRRRSPSRLMASSATVPFAEVVEAAVVTVLVDLVGEDVGAGAGAVAMLRALTAMLLPPSMLMTSLLSPLSPNSTNRARLHNKNAIGISAL